MAAARGRKAILASKGRPDPRVRKAFKECPARKARPARKAPKDLKGRRGKRVKRETRETRGDSGLTGLRSVQADGAVSCESSETLVSAFCPGGGSPDGAKCATGSTVGLCLKKQLTN